MVFTKLYQLSASGCTARIFESIEKWEGKASIGRSISNGVKQGSSTEKEGEQRIRRREKKDKEEGTVLNKASTEGE